MARLTIEEHRSTYGNLKCAESEILRWIRERSPPRENGKSHAYSHHEKLARVLEKKGVHLPTDLALKLQCATEGRAKLLRHHMADGSADAGHVFALNMMRSIAAALSGPQDKPAVSAFLETTNLDFSTPIETYEPIYNLDLLVSIVITQLDTAMAETDSRKPPPTQYHPLEVANQQAATTDQFYMNYYEFNSHGYPANLGHCYPQYWQYEPYGQYSCWEQQYYWNQPIPDLAYDTAHTHHFN